MSTEKHPVRLELSEEDLELLYSLLESGIAKSKAIIDRSRNYPSETIRSSMTIKKHEGIIQHIEELRDHIVENSLR